MQLSLGFIGVLRLLFYDVIIFYSSKIQKRFLFLDFVLIQCLVIK